MYIRGAQPVGVAHDRHACLPLDVAHQRVGAAGDHQVDVPVLVKERLDLVARLHGLYEVG